MVNRDECKHLLEALNSFANAATDFWQLLGAENKSSDYASLLGNGTSAANDKLDELMTKFKELN